MKYTADPTRIPYGPITWSEWQSLIDLHASVFYPKSLDPEELAWLGATENPNPPRPSSRYSQTLSQHHQEYGRRLSNLDIEYRRGETNGYDGNLVRSLTTAGVPVRSNRRQDLDIWPAKDKRDLQGYYVGNFGKYRSN